MITSHMHVKAPGFPRHPKDDELVNDFMSGFSLADAIKSELMERGYDGLQLIDEDWGWLVVAFNRASNTELRVMVSSLADPEDDDSSVVGSGPIDFRLGACFTVRKLSGEHV